MAHQGSDGPLPDTPVSVEPFGTLGSGRGVDRVRLRSSSIQVDVITLGARVTSVLAPDRDGALGEVTLGFDDLTAYENDHDHLGGCIGRYANRIAAGAFVLDGATFTIPTNEAHNALHGGPVGFERHPWTAEVGSTSEVTLRRVSEDGEMGFPGRLEVAVTYRVEGSDLSVQYAASTSMPTVVNLTNHAYFNLAGGGNVEDHVVTVDAERFLPVDGELIPTGELRSVDGTPLDLRSGVRIGDGLRAPHEQLRLTRGFDHTFVLRGQAQPNVDESVRRAARVADPRSGRTIELWTDRPGMQFYSGNSLDGSLVGRGGMTYRQTDAFCLEPQHFPDSPNHPEFPTTVLRPGEVYRARDLYRFGTEPYVG
jgi:aldose 1-epimerase